MTGRNQLSPGSAADGDGRMWNSCAQPEDDRTAPVAADRLRMFDAALGYGARGIPVFPCHHPLPETHGRGWRCSCSDRDCSRAAKHPLTRHGLKDATTRADVITAWWQRWPQANIAIPTGAIFDVLDIDGPDGIRAVDKLGLSRSLRAHTPVARTGNGWHYLFTPTSDGNRVRVADGLDWRGQGGYVIAPPSRHVNGSAYRWVRPFDTVDLARVPTALANLLVREPRTHPADPLRAAPPAGQRGYGQAALADELDQVRQAQPGQRNHTLNRAAFRCFQLAAAGLLDPERVAAEMTTAARQIGLIDTETRRTLASARQAGMANPRSPARNPRATSRDRAAPAERDCERTR